MNKHVEAVPEPVEVVTELPEGVGSNEPTPEELMNHFDAQGIPAELREREDGALEVWSVRATFTPEDLKRQRLKEKAEDAYIAVMQADVEDVDDLEVIVTNNGERA